MKKQPINKGLIKEISDIKLMMNNLETSSSKRLLNEQSACDFGNGGCHPDCLCIPVGFPAYNQTSMDLDTDCCCGNEIPTINGCLPGPCMDHTDCNPGQDCCYADAGMMSLGFPSCNAAQSCYDYPPGSNSNPNSSTIAGCMDQSALNFNSSANTDNEECCYDNNSGCMMPGMINFSMNNECDCSNNWQSIGFGNNTCCTTTVTIGGTGQGGDHSGTATVTLGSLGHCFTENSMVLMEEGVTKPINKIKIGDVVKSEVGFSQVIGIDIHEGDMEVYSINKGDAFVTEEHPFKTLEGWKAINPIETFRKHQVNSNILKEGDTILKIDGKEEIKSIEKGETVNKVYNLLLDNEHVYYVNGYLVHNGKNVVDGGLTPVGDLEPDFGDMIDVGNKPPKDKPLPINRRKER